MRLRETAKLAYEVGDLHSQNYFDPWDLEHNNGYNRLEFSPSDFLRGASEKGYDVPEPFRDLISDSVNKSDFNGQHRNPDDTKRDISVNNQAGTEKGFIPEPELEREWNKQTFEILEYMSMGLRAYSRRGRRILDPSNLPKEYRALRDIEKNLKTKSTKKFFWDYRKTLSDSLFSTEPYEEMDFNLPFDDQKAEEALAKVRTFLFKVEDVNKFAEESGLPCIAEDNSSSSITIGDHKPCGELLDNGLEGFELFSLFQQGRLHPYRSDNGMQIIDLDTVERRPKQSFEDVLANENWVNNLRGGDKATQKVFTKQGYHPKLPDEYFERMAKGKSGGLCKIKI